MQIAVLPLETYVAKFLERPRQGHTYLAEESTIYRANPGAEQYEDVGQLPADLVTATVHPVAIDFGTFVGDPTTIARIRQLDQQLQAIAEQLAELQRA